MNECIDRKPRFRGFTLIELLAVIAIVTILASILIPVISNVRERGLIVERMSNLRALGNAALLHANDNQGSLPYLTEEGKSAWKGPFWYNHLESYLPKNKERVTYSSGTKADGSEVLNCPLVPDGQHVGCDYGGSSALFYIPSESPNGSPAKLTTISNPESVVMIASSEKRATGDPSWYLNARYYVNFPSGSSNFPSGKWTRTPFIAAVFADGHYEEIQVDEFEEKREQYMIPINLLESDWN